MWPHNVKIIYYNLKKKNEKEINLGTASSLSLTAMTQSFLDVTKRNLRIE